MMKFGDLGISPGVIVGKGIEIDELFGRKIIIEKTIIKPTNFPGKNTSGLRMQMQICIPETNIDGSFAIDDKGRTIGERRSCFTGSDILIESIETAEKKGQELKKDIYPLETTIIKTGKCFQFI